MNRPEDKKILLNLAAISIISLLITFVAVRSGTFYKRAFKQPDVILITSGTLRPDHLGCYGYTLINTTNIKSLAESSIIFDNAYANTPIPFYGYASIMTGEPGINAVDITGDQIGINSKIKLLSEFLREKGYKTAAVVTDPRLSNKTGFARGFDLFILPPPPSSPEEADPYHIAEKATRKALDIFGSFKKDNAPTFLWIQYNLPAFPYTVFKDNPYLKSTNPYDIQVLMVDLQLKEIISGLKEMNVWNNSLAIFTAGSGDPLNEHKEATAGTFVYNSTVKVPLIIKMPAMHESLRIEENVTLADIKPTILSALEIDHESSPSSGESLLPAIEQPEGKESDVLLVSDLGHNQFGWSPVAGIVSGGYKYIDLPEPELYDLEADPFELDNIATEMPAKAEELKAKLIEQINTTRPELLDILGTGADPKEMISISTAVAMVKPNNLYSAIALYKSMLKKDPDNRMALLLLGRDYYRDNRLESATSVLKELVEKYPDSNKGWELLAMISDRQGDRTKALEYYEKAIAIAPNSPISLNNAAWIYADTGKDLKKALKYSETAVDLVPTSEYFLDTLAYVNEKLGNAEKAQEIREKMEEITRSTDDSPQTTESEPQSEEALESQLDVISGEYTS